MLDLSSSSPPHSFSCVTDKGTGGEVANALVCKTSIHGFKSHSVLHNFNNLREIT
jgi:hypothetical protein